jgi:hypothetical protein
MWDVLRNSCGEEIIMAVSWAYRNYTLIMFWWLHLGWNCLPAIPCLLSAALHVSLGKALEKKTCFSLLCIRESIILD